MRNKTLALLLVLTFVFISLAGCDLISFNDPAIKRRDSISKYIDENISGNETGEIGKSYTSKWFEFKIHSIDKVDAYASRKTKEGHQLYKVLITLKSTWDKPIPMGTFDFYMDAPDFTEYIWGIPPLDDSMMPEKFELKPSESVQYVIIFEAPTNTAELAFLYTENYESGDEGASFAFYVD